MRHAGESPKRMGMIRLSRSGAHRKMRGKATFCVEICQGLCYTVPVLPGCLFYGKNGTKTPIPERNGPAADAGQGQEVMMDRKELLRTVKFVLFSISAGVIEIGAYTLLDHITPWNYWACYLVALVLSVLWNFTLNREFTFQSANNVPVAMLKVAAYYLVFTPLSTVLGNYLTETVGWNGYLVTVLNMLLNFATEYLYDRFFVFRDSIDTNKRAKEKG